jgi:hypothetical protein
MIYYWKRNQQQQKTILCKKLKDFAYFFGKLKRITNRFLVFELMTAKNVTRQMETSPK